MIPVNSFADLSTCRTVEKNKTTNYFSSMGICSNNQTLLITEKDLTVVMGDWALQMTVLINRLG